MLPTFDFLVKIDEIYVTSQHFGEMSGTLPTKYKIYDLKFPTFDNGKPEEFL